MVLLERNHRYAEEHCRHVPNGAARIAGAAHTVRVSHANSESLSTAVGEHEPGPLRRAAEVAGDLMGVVAVVFCIPLVILAIGTPIALFLQLLLWIGGLL